MDEVQDLADQAEAAEQRHRDAALAARKPTLKPCGKCYYCGETVKGGHLFCDGYCRDDWEAEKEARLRNEGTR